MKALKTFGIAICAFLAFCVVVAIFDDNDSSSENKTEPQQSEQTEQKQETESERQAREQKEKEENNPIAKFVGTYQIYDDYGNKQFSHFKITEDGRFCKSIIKITLEEGRKNTSEYDVLGKIEVVSNNVFSVHLTDNFFLDGVVDSDGDELRPWANHGNVTHAMLIKEFEKYSDLIFDISDNKMYFDKEEYDNKDLKSPYYYKFTFTK